MTRRHRPRSAASWAVVAGLLALTGCSSTATDSAPEPGPVTAILDSLWATEDDDGTRLLTDIENGTARCMTEQGFEYIPSIAGSSVTIVSGPPDPLTEDWVRRNGYGVSIPVTDSEQTDETATPAAVDPNATYVASLSPTELAAYTAALNGAPTDGASPDDEYRWEDAGCFGAAHHEATAGLETLQSSSVYIDVTEKLDALDESALTSPATVEASAAWADCMADAGYPGHAAPADARAAITAAWEEEFVPFAEFPGTLKGPSSDAAAEFRATELATALADVTCNEEVGWSATVLAVQVELEEAFVKDHQAELDEFVVAVEAARW